LVVPISREDLANHFPVLFHMAAEGSWPSIEQHGLLSTIALLELFDVDLPTRKIIVEQHRPESIPITHAIHGSAVVRDQKPMDDVGLVRALEGGLQPIDWYQILNAKVFFWVTERRLRTMMNARAYREQPKTILYVDTAELLDRHLDRVVLAPMNTGATKPMPFPRGPQTFRPLDEYPFEERLKKNRRDPIVELAVHEAVRDIRECVIRVEAVHPGAPTEVLFER
jgi:hypothetical protein